MSFLRRRRSVPASLKPALDPAERVLTWCYAGASEDHQVIVVTNHGLWLPGRHRLGWHEIHKVAWSGRELRVTPAEVSAERDGYQVLVDGTAVTYLLLDPGHVPDQVRTRVTKSVGYTSHQVMPAGGVRVVGRRVPGRDGLSWAVRYDTGTKPDSPGVAELTGTLVAAARKSMTVSV